MSMNFHLPNLRHLDANNFFLISGPCAIEGEDMAYEIAEKIIKITERLAIPYIFKGSYRKKRFFHRYWRRKSLKNIKRSQSTFWHSCNNRYTYR
jgi:2-dehydro-3-deoxyphosphooctonate aldolase (KDO 8-P synthase)